jgi:hypothetical protein
MLVDVYIVLSDFGIELGGSHNFLKVPLNGRSTLPRFLF